MGVGFGGLFYFPPTRPGAGDDPPLCLHLFIFMVLLIAVLTGVKGQFHQNEESTLCGPPVRAVHFSPHSFGFVCIFTSNF